MHRTALLLLLVAGLVTAPVAAGYHGGTPAGVFDVTYSGVKGNEWWAQASVSTVHGTLSHVEVRRDEGAWKPLTDRGWGWAASYHLPAGSIVQFRAVATDGQTDLSGCYEWTSARAVSCPGEGATVRRLAFDHHGGNEWWVELKISGEGASEVTNVLAFSDSDIGELTLRSWGVWAGSLHIPPGDRVRFEALGPRMDEFSCWFTHPAGVEQCDGSQTSPPPPTNSTFDATFTNARGNEWWIETDVRATGGQITFVEAMVGDGPRVQLSKTSWGSWAKSVHAPAGSEVRFIAYTTDGSSDASATYAWPPR